MTTGTKRLLRAIEQKMNLAPLPKDLKEASIEQLAQILGVSQAELAAMTEEDLQAIIDEGTST
ncbi:MAG: hypothetical protein HY777_16705 [Betaproteobacteria bacterium]|nr:hypothetical protein [Betaproteobacteria bacterium]